jgi:hypothetical protein
VHETQLLNGVRVGIDRERRSRGFHTNSRELAQ